MLALPVKLGWLGSPGSVQLPPSEIALILAQPMPAGSRSQTVRPVIGTSLELADVPLLVASTRKTTASPSATCTLSVLAGLVGVEPLTLATPLVRPTGGAAAIEKSTP